MKIYYNETGMSITTNLGSSMDLDVQDLHDVVLREGIPTVLTTEEVASRDKREQLKEAKFLRNKALVSLGTKDDQIAALEAKLLELKGEE